MLNKILKKSAILLFWVAVWQMLSMLVSNALLIPSPLDTLKSLVSLAQTENFYISIAFSLIRIIIGFLLGVTVGFLCGVLSANNRVFKDFTTPLLQLIKSVPVASFIILAFFWFESGKLPIFISFLMVVPIIWSSVETALLSLDKKYVEMGKVFSLSTVKIFFKIKLALIFPAFLSAALTSLGFAWKSGIAAEVIAKPLSSLGGLLERSKTHLEISEVFALTVIVALLSLALELLLKKLLGRYNYVKNR